MYQIVKPEQVGERKDGIYFRAYPTGQDFRQIEIDIMGTPLQAKGCAGVFFFTDDPARFRKGNPFPLDLLKALAHGQTVLVIAAGIDYDLEMYPVDVVKLVPKGWEATSFSHSSYGPGNESDQEILIRSNEYFKDDLLLFSWAKTPR